MYYITYFKEKNGYSCCYYFEGAVKIHNVMLACSGLCALKMFTNRFMYGTAQKAHVYYLSTVIYFIRYERCDSKQWRERKKTWI